MVFLHRFSHGAVEHPCDGGVKAAVQVNDRGLRKRSGALVQLTDKVLQSCGRTELQARNTGSVHLQAEALPSSRTTEIRHRALPRCMHSVS